MQPKSIALLEDIDYHIEQLLQKFQDIFDVAVILDKSKELLAVESLAMETDALSIIRFCEDLLAITKGLKETWCLDTIKVQQLDKTVEQEEINRVFSKFNQLTDEISKFNVSH